MGIAKDSKGSYKLTGKTTEHDVLQAAEHILKSKLERQGSISNPTDATDFLRMRLGHASCECKADDLALRLNEGTRLLGRPIGQSLGRRRRGLSPRA